MSESTVVHWPMPGAGEGDEPGYVCPECGASNGLTVAMDLEDRSAHPSYFRCPAGHVWPEPCFPRLLGAGMLQRALAANPNLVDDLRG